MLKFIQLHDESVRKRAIPTVGGERGLVLGATERAVDLHHLRLAVGGKHVHAQTCRCRGRLYSVVDQRLQKCPLMITDSHKSMLSRGSNGVGGSEAAPSAPNYELGGRQRRAVVVKDSG